MAKVGFFNYFLSFNILFHFSGVSIVLTSSGKCGKFMQNSIFRTDGNLIYAFRMPPGSMFGMFGLVVKVHPISWLRAASKARRWTFTAFDRRGSALNTQTQVNLMKFLCPKKGRSSLANHFDILVHYWIFPTTHIRSSTLLSFAAITLRFRFMASIQSKQGCRKSSGESRNW